MRAGHLLRRDWRATLFLALLAGLAGGIAMSAFSLGRQASTSFERFLDYAGAGDLIVNICPPEIDVVTEDSLSECFDYDPAAEAAVLRSLPEVATAGRITFRGLTAALPADPGRTFPANVIQAADPELLSLEGRSIIVAGRPSDPAAADEVTVNELFAQTTGVEIGDEVDLTFWGDGELGAPASEGQSFTGPKVRVRVVGIERGFRDLIAEVGTRSAALDEARVTAGPALAASTVGGPGFNGVGVVSNDGDDEATRDAIVQALAGRQFNISPVLDDDDNEPIAEAIRFEAGATTLFGAITALAAAVFAGQAVSRQSRREWTDGPALRAIGMSDRDAAASSLLRGAVTGAGAAAIAGGSSIGLGALGPFGLGGRVEIDQGAVIDVSVLLLGGSCVLLAVAAATWWPVALQFRRPARRVSAPRATRLQALHGRLPAPAAAGLTMTTGRPSAGGLPTGTALVGVVLAVATALGAIGLTASLDRLTETPANFGAPWDVAVSASLDDPDDDVRLFDQLRGDPRIEAAAGLVGTDVSIGDEVAWVMGFEPVDGIDGIVAPVITSGRAPAAIDEIALGTATMDQQGASIGDRIDVGILTSSTERPAPMTVVGTTVINDGAEENPGRGGIVTLEWLDRYAEETSSDPFVFRLVPGADAAAFAFEIEVSSDAYVEGPVLQGAIRNIERISVVPFLLAALVGVLAVASLAHALVLSVRRQRSQLAILKSLGFRRGQVRSTVAWQASALVLAAAIVGVPLGIIIGRWGWRLVADELGVASAPVTPLLWLAVIVVGALAVANLVAAYPAWRAAREPTAQTLRAE